MKTKLIAIVILLALVCVIVFTNIISETSGASQARKDIKNHNLKYYIYGELAPYEDEASKYIFDTYGIVVQRVSYSVVSSEEISRAKAYNKTINKHLNIDYDIFNRVVNDIIKKYE